VPARLPLHELLGSPVQTTKLPIGRANQLDYTRPATSYLKSHNAFSLCPTERKEKRQYVQGSNSLAYRRTLRCREQTFSVPRVSCSERRYLDEIPPFIPKRRCTSFCGEPFLGQRAGTRIHVTVATDIQDWSAPAHIYIQISSVRGRFTYIFKKKHNSCKATREIARLLNSTPSKFHCCTDLLYIHAYVSCTSGSCSLASP
jgi:hypothetical protein